MTNRPMHKPMPSIVAGDPRDLTAIRREFDECLQAGDLSRLDGILGAEDPFVWPALFRAISYLLDAGEQERLSELAPLTRTAPHFSRFIWQCLVDHVSGDITAVQRLYAVRTGPPPLSDRTLGALRRRLRRALGLRPPVQAPIASVPQQGSAYCWGIYASAPRFDLGPGDPGLGPDILQFWDSDAIPDDVAEAIAAFRDLAGDRHHFFNAESAADFLHDAYGADAVEAFRSCRHPAIQSDFFRLGYLALKGGLYIDADSRIREDFSHLWPRLTGKTVLAFQTRKPGIFFQNGMLAAPPGTALMAEAFQEAGRRLKTMPQSEVVRLAGPLMLRDVAIRLHRAGRLDPIETLSFETLDRHLLQSFPAQYKKDTRHWSRWRKDEADE